MCFGPLVKRFNTHAFHACTHGFESRTGHHCNLAAIAVFFIGECMIKSKNNQFVKEVKKLRMKKFRDDKQLFVVEGRHLVAEAVASGCVKYILSSACVEYDNVYLCSHEIVEYLDTSKTSQGIIAVCEKPKLQPLGDKIILLDGLKDPGNLGTIVRSAVAFGFTTIVCGHNCVDVYNEKVLRATQGGIFHLNVEYVELSNFITANSTYDYLCLDIRGDSQLPDINCEKVALIIGSEAQGISSRVQALISKSYRIPMVSKMESLNAGISGSIMMHKVMEICGKIK